MRSLPTFFLLVLIFAALGSLAHAQSAGPADKTTAAASAGATKEEVQQLRSEVAEQRQTIEELKTMVQRLVEANSQASNTGLVDSQAVNGARLVNATLVQPVLTDAPALLEQQPAAKKEPPPIAGWNGEHFFIRSPDGLFQIQPYGYFQTDYRADYGDGAPPNTFLIRRARFGFQGNYGSHYNFALLIDSAASNGVSLRDLYVNIKPIN